jgi:hypothetical protein
MPDGSNSSTQDGGGAADGDHRRRLDVAQVSTTLAELHEQVCRRRLRVEITREGCDDCCVLISRQELEAIDRALAIFADTDEVKAVAGKIAELAAAARADFAMA